jgi:Neuraminidase (sialidase)
MEDFKNYWTLRALRIYNKIGFSAIVKSIAYSMLILIISGCNSQPETSKAGTNNKNVMLRLDPGTDNPRNSEGDFVTLKDGRILFIYTHYTGSSGDDNGNAYLAGRYSTDNGKSWTKESVKIIEQEGKMNVMSVSLLRLKNGEIALFYLRINAENDCIPIIRISDDEAETWSDPQPCITDKVGYFVLNNNRVIQLQNGRILLAVALHNSFKERIGSIWSYYSDDNGRTWKAGKEAANPDSVITQEPGLIELKDGRIFMFMRTTSGVQYVSYSMDGGDSWSAVGRSEIKSPCSPASIARIPSTGDLLMVWNNNGVDQKRTPLTIAISKDEGINWEKIKNLEVDPGGTFCYSAIHFTDKYLLLGYSNWANMGSVIRRIDIDWIYQ